MLRIGIATAALLAAAPVLAANFDNASSTPTGDELRVAAILELTGGHSWFDDSFGGYEASHFNASGRVSWMVKPRFSAQFDAWDEEMSFDPGGDSRFYGGAVHLSWRAPASHLIGALVSVGNAFDANYANVALEAKYYLGNLTLYGQAGYGWGFGDAGDGQTMPYAHFLARYFCNPDAMLEGQVGYGLFDNGFGTTDVVRWEAKAEKKLRKMPLAVFVAYQGTWNHGDGFPDVIEHAVLGGVSLVSAPSLKANDRGGASLIDLNPLFGQPTWRF